MSRPIYACDGRTELFFPEHDGDHSLDLAYAATLCTDCPNLNPCRDNEVATMRTNGLRSFGVFGGTTPADRRRIVTGAAVVHDGRVHVIDWTVMRPLLHHARERSRALRIIGLEDVA